MSDCNYPLVEISHLFPRCSLLSSLPLFSLLYQLSRVFSSLFSSRSLSLSLSSSLFEARQLREIKAEPGYPVTCKEDVVWTHRRKEKHPRRSYLSRNITVQKEKPSSVGVIWSDELLPATRSAPSNFLEFLNTIEAVSRYQR